MSKKRTTPRGRVAGLGVKSIPREPDHRVILTKSAAACCIICNPAGLADYERPGVHVERLGHTLELCHVCIEALRLLLRSERSSRGELTMNAECAALAIAFLDGGHS